MTIGERIKQTRKAKGLTQKQLGELSETSEGTVRQYEIGKRQPRLEQLRRIATALEVEWTDLVDGEEQGQKIVDHLTERLKNTGPLKKISIEEAYRLGLLNVEFHSEEDRIAFYYGKLNTDGKLAASKCFYQHLDKSSIKEVADYVEKLSEIPQYQRTDTPQPALAPLEGEDTSTPAEPGAESPEDGE